MNHNNSGCTSGNIPTNNNDVIPPLVIIITHSSRYKALFVTLLAYIFMCFFLVADNTLGWGFPIFFGLETLFTGYLAVKYWQIGNTPVVQFNGHLVFVRDLAKPIPIEKIVAFNYQQDIKGTLIFKLACDESDFLIKRRFADLMLLMHIATQNDHSVQCL